MAEKYPFLEEHVHYYTKRAAQNAEIKQVWRELSAPDAKGKTGCPRYVGPYEQFIRRVRRITSEQIDTYRVDTVRTPEQQVAYLSKIIGAGSGKTTDKLRALQMLQDLQAKLDANDPTKATPDGRTMLANPKAVKLDAEYLIELVMSFRDEFGGLHKLPLDDLNEHDLRLLARGAAQVLATKSGTDDLISLLEGIERKGESRTMKLKRLQWELQNLTEDEIFTIETKDLSEIQEGDDNEND